MSRSCGCGSVAVADQWLDLLHQYSRIDSEKRSVVGFHGALQETSLQAISPRQGNFLSLNQFNILTAYHSSKDKHFFPALWHL